MSALSVIEHAAVSAAAPREVLSSRLGAEDYGIDLLAVQEIRRYEPPTRIANAASHVAGVIDLRGVIVPIVDLRRRMGLPDGIDAQTVTVIVTLPGRTLGLVVDSVCDVVALDRAQIQPRPSLGGADADFIAGLAGHGTTDGHRLLQLLDLDALLRDL